MKTVRGNETAISAELKRAIAGVPDGGVRAQNLEVAGTINSDIQRIFGLHHVALRVQFLGGNYTCTGTEHQAGWSLAVGCGIGACLTHVLVEQILKHGTVTFKAHGVDVR